MEVMFYRKFDSTAINDQDRYRELICVPPSGFPVALPPRALARMAAEITCKKAVSIIIGLVMLLINWKKDWHVVYFYYK